MLLFRTLRHGKRTGPLANVHDNPGETFLDRMIALVEGVERKKTLDEVAFNILIAGLTLIFLLAVVTSSSPLKTRKPRPDSTPSRLARTFDFSHFERWIGNLWIVRVRNRNHLPRLTGQCTARVGSEAAIMRFEIAKL